jgi:streptomycin 6-kinase
MSEVIEIPRPVRLKALAAGKTGEIWLAGLGSILSELAQSWKLTLGRPLLGGTEALVVEATTADGRQAVLKILPPTPAQVSAGELETLRVAGGHGYADVYAYDEARATVLLERLGTPLAALDLPIDAQIAIICETLSQAWVTPPKGAQFTTGEEKARV